MLDGNFPESDRLRIKQFVDLFLSHDGGGFALNVPPEMLSGLVQDDGWASWKAIDSPVKFEDLKPIEQQLGVKLPSLFKAYLCYRCLLMTHFIVRLPQIPCSEPMSDFENYLRPFFYEPFYRNNSLVPFGYDGNDEGLACFDVSVPDSDYPIVIVDHGRTNQDGYRGDVKWPSFGRLLDDIEAEMLSYD